MASMSVFMLPEQGRRSKILVLSLSFFLGHLLGIRVSGAASDFFISGMRLAASSQVSIIGLLISAVLPFLFSAFAVYLGRPVLLNPIAFCKAFLFSYVGYRWWITWNQAGWLVTGLVMFTSFLSLPVLFWYWLRYIDGRKLEWHIFLLVLGCLLAIGIADQRWIMPFLRSIINLEG